MSTSNEENILQLIETGNEIKGHPVDSPIKAEIKENIKRAFANARDRQKCLEMKNIIGRDL